VKDSDNPEVLFVLGMMALKERRHETSIELLNRAIGLDRQNADYHYSLGVAYRGLGQPGRASDCYKAALRLRPDYVEVHNELGDLLAASGALDPAVASFQRAIGLRPDCAKAHYNLAGALGVPVWMALSTTPDWRWMSDREDNPWYPTMRIFRQGQHTVWGPVFERMAAELHALATTRARTPAVQVGIAPGELIDKITILEIKAERISDPEKLEHVRSELAVLTEARDRSIFDRGGVAVLTTELRAINEALWRIEDEIRVRECAGDFGPRFVELARSVYQTNDHRAAVKRQINERLGSELIEEKSYTVVAAAPRAPVA
jgi:hypothetical protein